LLFGLLPEGGGRGNGIGPRFTSSGQKGLPSEKREKEKKNLTRPD